MLVPWRRPMPDLTLADLASDRWTQVARRVRATPHTDGWEWHLPPADVSALQVEVTLGTVLVANARDADGRPILKAKRTRQPCPAERFAVMGRGMFEQ